MVNAERAPAFLGLVFDSGRAIGVSRGFFLYYYRFLLNFALGQRGPVPHNH
jgi:hypothetical protein